MPVRKNLNFPTLAAPRLEGAVARALPLIDRARVDATAIRLIPQRLPAGLTIAAGPRAKFQLARPSVIAFIDDLPGANWAHPCRYCLLDADRDEAPYEVIAAEFPPYLVEGEVELVEAKPARLPLARGEGLKFPAAIGRRAATPLGPIPGLQLAAGRRFALLYSGQSDARHLNDLEFLYRVLVDLYGYDPANILVANHDGTLNHNQVATRPLDAWPGDRTPYRIRVTHDGSRAGLAAAFEALRGRLRSGDSLLIHTNNHGGRDGDGNSYLCTREADASWGGYWASELGDRLAALPKIADLVVMMEQCFSGGFSAAVTGKSSAARTTFAAAAAADQVSWGGQDFDCFAEDWVAAIAGYEPTRRPLVFISDADQSGEVSAGEAFAYANDPRAKYAQDTPNFAEKPAGAGARSLVGQRIPPEFIDVASWGPGRLNIFVRGTDAALHHRAFGPSWSGWESLGGVILSAPKVVSWGPGRLDVFAVGTDQALYHRAFDGAWHPWESLGGQLKSAPEVVSWGPGRLDIFARGQDDALWHHWYQVGSGWGAWESLGGVITGQPEAVSWGPGRLDIFARGQDGALWHRWWSGAWGGWESLGGALTSDPSAASWGPGRLDIFARGQDGALLHRWWSGSWGGWEPLGGALTSQPSAIAWGPGRLDIFARGRDRGLDHLWYQGQWGSWESLGGIIVSTPEVVSWAAGRLDIFALGLDHAVWHRWWNGAWGGWESLGGVVA